MDRNHNLRYLTAAGILASIITLMTAYLFHLPVGINGGYVHFGDGLIYLAAALLPRPYAMGAAIVGGGLADLLTAPMWTLPTMIIKALLVLPFSSAGAKIITPRNMTALVPAYLITGIGYCVAEYILFESSVVVLVSMLQSLIQSVGSAVFFVVLGLALDRAKLKIRFQEKIER